MADFDIKAIKIKKMKPEHMEYSAEQIAILLGSDDVDDCYPSSEFGLGVRFYLDRNEIVEDILADIVPTCSGIAFVAISEEGRKYPELVALVNRHVRAITI